MMDRRQLPQRKPKGRRKTDSSTGGGNRPKSGRNRPSGDELGTKKVEDWDALGKRKGLISIGLLAFFRWEVSSEVIVEVKFVGDGSRHG